jgi:hypothetical protein
MDLRGTQVKDYHRLALAIADVVMCFTILGCNELIAATTLDYALIPLVRPGQEAPGTGGATFAEIGSFAMNNRGEVAFGARISGATRTFGVFLLSGGTIRKLALSGELAPYIGAPFTEGFDSVPLAINDLGQVAFAARVGGFSGQVGVFYFRANDLFPIAVLPPILPGSADRVTGLSLNNNWEIAFTTQSSLYLYSQDCVTPVVIRGQAVPGGGAFQSFSGVAINNFGQIAFYAHSAGGLFLYSNGIITPIVREGESGPGVAGSRFDRFEFRLDDAGEVLFAGDQVFNANAMGVTYRRFGIYLFARGAICPVAIIGQPVASQDVVLSSLSTFDMSRSGKIAVSASSSGQPFQTYVGSSDGFAGIRGFADGIQPYGAAQAAFYVTAVDDTGALMVRSASEYQDLLLALPLPLESVPADDFEVAGSGGLPIHWRSVWSNGGTGNAAMYDSSLYSYTGSSMLRLHVGPGGGSVFVLSDPIQILPGREYAVTVQMRYALASDSDSAFFTVLQYDSAGKEIALDELCGTPADNRWTWKEEAIYMRTLPNAAWIRIRFGLSATVEAYLDVDALK